jgi:hypothetical protein
MDGKAATNRAFITGTITFDSPLPSGGTFYVRWHDWNDGSTSDHWLAIDDLQITFIPAQGIVKPSVLSVNPLAGAVNVPLNTTIDFTLADGSPSKVQTNSIRLWFNGQSVLPTINRPTANRTTVTYDPPGDLAPEETNTVRLVFSDDATPPYWATNDYSFVTAPTMVPLVAIDDTTLWRYEDSGTDLGTAWKEKNYDDSAWLEGAALLGYEGTVVELLRTPLVNYGQITYYFRIHFNCSMGWRLRLRHVLDDGAVFYLNGAEVHRFGLAAGAPFDASTLFTDHENVYEGPFVIPTASLVQGDNVLAVEVHQFSSGSSDLVFGAVLEAITSHPARNTIEAVTPAPNVVDVPRDATIGLTLLDGTQKVQPGSVRLWVNNGEVTPVVNKPTGSTVTTVSYSPGASQPYGSTVRVKLVFSDDGPVPNVTTNEWSYTVVLESMVLLAIDEVILWRYEDSGTDLGTTWKDKNYNDSEWSQGAALLGWESTAVELLRTQVNMLGQITWYFRTHFNYTNTLTGVGLRLRHVLDDGAVFYLNGVEVHRFGLAAGAPLDASTLFTDHENKYEGPFDIPTASLVQGDNVFAVELHQSGAASSDVVFGAELKAMLLPPPPPTFTSARLEGGGLRIEWTGTGTLQQASVVTGGVWTDAPSQSNPQIVPTTGAAGFYRLKQ